MKTTGIVRRIDRLGRIVIPKEIRKSLSIKDEENLEILLEEDYIILKKYQTMEKLIELAKVYAKELADLSHFIVCMTDTDKVVAISGDKKEKYLGEEISDEVRELMTERCISFSSDQEVKSILKSDLVSSPTSQLIVPIIADAQVIGNIILFTYEKNKKITDLEIKLAELTAKYLGNKVES